LEDHRNIVSKKLNDDANPPDIRDKYVWVADYHNYFCGEHSYYFGDEYKIDVANSKYKFSGIK
jgi:hypothetical protein